MVTRKIWLDANRFVSCEVDDRSSDTFDFYTCPKDRVFEVVSAIRNNGMLVASIDGNRICVNHTKMWFQVDLYKLRQCSDLFEWFGESKKGEFTYYYDRVVFHTHSGKFCAAYFEDLNNYIEI